MQTEYIAKKIKEFKKMQEEKEADMQQSMRDYPEIYQFFDKYFGEAMSMANKRRMVDVITGVVHSKENSYKGVVLPNLNWFTGLKALGILDENNKYPKSESGGINAYQITSELKDAYLRMKNSSSLN